MPGSSTQYAARGGCRLVSPDGAPLLGRRKPRTTETDHLTGRSSSWAINSWAPALLAGRGRDRRDPAHGRVGQPFSVTVLFGCRCAVEPVTYRPVIALR